MTRRDMKRKQVEAKIFNLLKEIRDIVHEYCPEDDYLDLSITGDYMSFNNAHWEHPEYGKIDFWVNSNVNRDNYFKEEE